jgi:hypothetical protein
MRNSYIIYKGYLKMLTNQPATKPVSLDMAEAVLTVGLSYL